jgi:FkbM family methyltransferase
MIHDVYSNFDCANTKASYYFFHIPKTAGTSLNTILESVFTPNEICPPHLWHELIAYDRDRLSSFRLFRGHFYASLNQVVDGPLRGFVFLRNPIERALSHYGHVVRDSGHYLHGQVIELGSLESYLRDPVTRETVCNFQAKCLVNHFDLIEMAARLSSVELAEFGLEKIIETSATDLSDAVLLEQAKRALDKFCCIGLTERFDDSVWLLSEAFGLDFKKSTEALNTNAERPRASKISKEELSLLEEINSVDIELYQYAVSLFEGRLKEHQRPIANTSNTFVSYAQNFEDVMLWRALKHVEHGSYIDVGAWSPDLDSVTRAFYERGWRGINIEPNPEFNRQLQERRPHDRNLRVAVGDREGFLAMNFLGNPGLSTLDDAIAEKHMQAGWSLERQEVQVTTLAAIWQEHVPAGQEVHFLKVDVEGFEDAALRGNDWSRHRPWIVVVEATLPMSQVESHESWEPILLAANYRFAYADGLNRFYVADEHVDLLPAFKYPPNVFDDFLLSRQQEVEARANQAEARASELEARANQAEAQASELEARANQAEARASELEARSNQAEARVSELEAALETTRKELHDVHQANHHHWHLAEARHQQIQALLSSTSWRITSPLRWVILAARYPNPGAFKPRAKILLQHAALYIRRRPRLKSAVLRGLYRFPWLKSRLFRIVPGIRTPSVQRESVPTDIAHLSPRARQIHADLKIAIERSQKENG